MINLPRLGGMEAASIRIDERRLSDWVRSISSGRGDRSAQVRCRHVGL